MTNIKQPSDEALKLIYQLIKKTSYPRIIKKEMESQKKNES
ncbi:hypothetical protein [Cytobacillus oceanisediminis]|nr:hypothetical protein [Cytobacillus oceanisediminis]